MFAELKRTKGLISSLKQFRRDESLLRLNFNIENPDKLTDEEWCDAVQQMYCALEITGQMKHDRKKNVRTFFGSSV